jgi:mannan endo-1,4-beta-mannosidase
MRGRLATFVLCSVVVIGGLAGCGLSAAGQGSGAGSRAGGPAVATSAAPTTVAKPVVPVSALRDPAGKFFGIEASGAPDSMTPVDAVSAEIGRNPNLIGQYVAWNHSFDAPAAASSLNYGALYFISWEPYGTTVRAIADGSSDPYIMRFAQAVRAFGKPVAISFGHEFNGNWYSWGTTRTTAADFTAAWRHIHDLFARAGASNVIWVWDANIVNPMPDVALKPYWPGDAYVDWVGLTGYFATTGPHTFTGVYGPTMSEVRGFTSKPFIIAETAIETGPAQVESTHNLISGVEGRSDVLGFIWFDYNKNGVDWTFSGRPSVRAAVAASVSGMRLVSLAS